MGLADVLNGREEESTETLTDLDAERLAKLALRADNWQMYGRDYIGSVDDISIVMRKADEGHTIIACRDDLELGRYSGAHEGMNVLVAKVERLLVQSSLLGIDEEIDSKKVINNSDITLDKAINFVSRGEHWEKGRSGNANTYMCEMGNMRIKAIQYDEGKYGLKIFSDRQTDDFGEGDVFETVLSDGDEYEKIKHLYTDTIMRINNQDEYETILETIAEPAPEIGPNLSLEDSINFASRATKWKREVEDKATFYESFSFAYPIRVVKFDKGDYKIKIFSNKSQPRWKSGDVFDSGFVEKGPLKTFYDETIPAIVNGTAISGIKTVASCKGEYKAPKKEKKSKDKKTSGGVSA